MSVAVRLDVGSLVTEWEKLAVADAVVLPDTVDDREIELENVREIVVDTDSDGESDPVTVWVVDAETEPLDEPVREIVLDLLFLETVTLLEIDDVSLPLRDSETLPLADAESDADILLDPVELVDRLSDDEPVIEPLRE